MNAILRHEGIDPDNVRLVRHKDTRKLVQLTPYNLWRAADGRFELYQRIQRRQVFQQGNFLASFVVNPLQETVFVGMYRVHGVKVAPPGTIDPSNSVDQAGLNLYDIESTPNLAEYVGKLVVDWGKGYLAWVQRAGEHDKPVIELRTDLREQPFPGFQNFRWSIEEIAAIPIAWQEVLRAVKGVYLLVCPDTGKQYVGSAKGDDSLWGRFTEYARTGHGGNVELIQRGRRNYMVSVLEVVNSDLGIERVEEAWKQKLMTRKFGLNKN